MSTQQNKWFTLNKIFGCGLILLITAGTAYANEADVTNVVVTAEENGTYRFDVTVLHADTGWDHYADKWEVVLPDGAITATRTFSTPMSTSSPLPAACPG